MSEPIVQISTGSLLGRTDTDLNSNTFCSFQGIPYGKPPIGSLRFKSPQPAEPWNGIRDAREEGQPSISRHSILNAVIGSEDCLFINVYTPKLPENGGKLKPVMFWIHGGGFTSGSSSCEIYGPQFLVAQDVVLVTFNYRLGIFGFLSLDDPDLGIPGNAGMKDMVLALKWVQENISKFNGDPHNVTIFGESAGAAACHYLILSPKAKGLFHKAILQSGCALNMWAQGSRFAQQLAQSLNWNTTEDKKILERIQEIDGEELYVLAERSLPDNFIICKVRPAGPVVERWSEDAFLWENPIDIIKSGKCNHVPILIGFTTREGMLSEILQKPKPFTPITDFRKSIPFCLKLNWDAEISHILAKKIKNFYYGNEEPTALNKDKFYLLESDNFFIREVLKTAKFHAEIANLPIYLYRMSIETSLNMMKQVNSISEPGVCHADDIGYLFKNLLSPDEFEPGSDEEIAVKRFTKMWGNFAKFANPNGQSKDKLINVVWQPITANILHFIDINTDLTVGVNPEKERMDFWDEIFLVNPSCKL